MADVPPPWSATSRGESISGRDAGVTGHLRKQRKCHGAARAKRVKIFECVFRNHALEHKSPGRSSAAGRFVTLAGLLVEDVLELRQERGIERERLGHHLLELFGGGRLQGELGF